MTRAGFFTVGLTAILLAFAGLYANSFKNASQHDGDMTLVLSPAPDTKHAITDKGKDIDTPSNFSDFDASEYGEISDEMKIALWVAKVDTKPKSEKIDAIVQNSRESSALLIKQLEEMGRGDDFKYLRNKMDYFNTFYNTSVIGESESQKEDVRNTLRDNLAIRMTSWGLDQKRAEQLQTLRYNVTEGGNRVLSLEATVNDFIALSENTKFGLDDNGTECLFFSSSAVKQYREIVYGSGDDSLFNPYCAYRDKFVSSYDPYDKNLSYDKIELEQLIKEFHQ